MKPEQESPSVEMHFSEQEGRRNAALLFQGQGSYEPDVAKSDYEMYPEVQALYAQAERILGYSPLDLTEDQLKETRFAQPAVFVYNEARRILYQKEAPVPTACAGNSLGEFNALVAAGAFTFKDGLLLVQARGEGMQQASNMYPGWLNALSFAPTEKGRTHCHEFLTHLSEVHELFLEAENSETQIVVGGLNKDKPSVQLVFEGLIEEGVRITPLNVAGPFHSVYMKPAEPYVREALSKIRIRRPRIPVIANTTARPIHKPQDIRKEIIDHLTMPVYWRQTIDLLDQEIGVAATFELGSKDILSRMMRHRGKIVVGSALAAAGVAAAIFLFRRSRS